MKQSNHKKNKPFHIPVLLDEVLEYLNPKPNQNFIDCTFGAGGHAVKIMERTAPNGKILAIDANPDTKHLISNWNPKFKERLILINDNFQNLKKIYEQYFRHPVSGVLFDLGLSTMELESSGRGFSFSSLEPLDMRFNSLTQRLTAAEILNRYSYKKLVHIFKQYGDISDNNAKNISKQIILTRRRHKFETTKDLTDLIIEKIKFNRKKKIHPATLFFQSLRLEVNQELDALVAGLSQAVEILAPGSRLAVISFHSAEDRIVKKYFKAIGPEAEHPVVKIITKKPIRPSIEEINLNPRSRSAKMRLAEKV